MDPIVFNEIGEADINLANSMLFEFCKGSNSTVATKNLCIIYPFFLFIYVTKKLKYR